MPSSNTSISFSCDSTQRPCWFSVSRYDGLWVDDIAKCGVYGDLDPQNYSTEPHPIPKVGAANIIWRPTAALFIRSFSSWLHGAAVALLCPLLSLLFCSLLLLCRLSLWTRCSSSKNLQPLSCPMPIPPHDCAIYRHRIATTCKPSRIALF